VKIDDDDFALFGLPRRHALDRTELDARWRALQARVHPDRFSADGAAAQRIAMQWAVRINEAHQRLKDPLARAAYLCELAGAPINAERNTAMPASFLAQQMHWREALEEAEDQLSVEALDQTVAARETELLDEVAKALDERHDPAAAAQRVRALMFLRKFRADVERRLEAFDA
jgi:molecular chaperone HscB